MIYVFPLLQNKLDKPTIQRLIFFGENINDLIIVTQIESLGLIN